MSEWAHGLPRRRLQVLANVDGRLVLAIAALCLCGLVFVGSATMDDVQFQNQQSRQALFVACGFGLGFFLLLPHYVHVVRGVIDVDGERLAAADGAALSAADAAPSARAAAHAEFLFFDLPPVTARS